VYLVRLKECILLTKKKSLSHINKLDIDPKLLKTISLVRTFINLNFSFFWIYETCLDFWNSKFVSWSSFHAGMAQRFCSYLHEIDQDTMLGLCA